MKKFKKISIIGAGAIGVQTALYLQQNSIYDSNIKEIILYNHNSDLAIGETADIIDSMFFHQLFSLKPTSKCKLIASSDLSDIKDSDVIIVSVGVKSKTIENKDRLAEIYNSYYIIKDIALAIKQYSKNSLVIMITNPVDILTWYMKEISGLPENKVVGIGVALDSARYAYNLQEELTKYKLKVKSVEALVIGLHSGSDMIMIESHVKVNSKKFCNIKNNFITTKHMKHILKNAREKTYERGFFIVKQKRQRSASISPAAIAANICLSYLKGEIITMPLSIVVNVKDLKKYNSLINQTACMGVMASINSKGATVKKLKLNDQEKDKFYEVLNHAVTTKKKFDEFFNNTKLTQQNLANDEVTKYFFIEEKVIQYINSVYNYNLFAHNDNSLNKIY